MVFSFVSDHVLMLLKLYCLFHGTCIEPTFLVSLVLCTFLIVIDLKNVVLILLGICNEKSATETEWQETADRAF